jgi:hypothetical protein
MKPSMKRKKDGRIIPYSEELVAAHPGEFLALKFDPAKRTFVEGAPLLPKAKPVPIDDDAVVFVDDGREKPPAAPRVDPEPDTSDEEDEGEDSKPPASSKPAEPEQPPADKKPEQPPADKGAEPSEPEQGEPAPETPEQDSDATVEKTAKRKKAKK